MKKLINSADLEQLFDPALSTPPWLQDEAGEVEAKPSLREPTRGFRLERGTNKGTVLWFCRDGAEVAVRRRATMIVAAKNLSPSVYVTTLKAAPLECRRSGKRLSDLSAEDLVSMANHEGLLQLSAFVTNAEICGRSLEDVVELAMSAFGDAQRNELARPTGVHPGQRVRVTCGAFKGRYGTVLASIESARTVQVQLGSLVVVFADNDITSVTLEARPTLSSSHRRHAGSRRSRQ